jgi:hypothetical protein
MLAAVRLASGRAIVGRRVEFERFERLLDDLVARSAASCVVLEGEAGGSSNPMTSASAAACSSGATSSRVSLGHDGAPRSKR